ncbi:hypothetical protein RMSM_02737 [Rhodopirellula maiorica SM1]|uniref:Uncharacterized protein n=1 Tax=Rhodopirellula maiorica SM1 TaxID=1265738 RepID=M5RY69_9BACT|nr:hypothetical protein [Rhodopirellula maiorica]EMI20332.1 hypothetical protein RMSM_02737 [Rhodopirellula maiorica SM1]
MPGKRGEDRMQAAGNQAEEQGRAAGEQIARVAAGRSTDFGAGKAVNFRQSEENRGTHF